MVTENLTGEVNRRGRIEVVCGSMFSGKTEELIRRLKRAKFAKQRVEIFKPAIDVRYSEQDVVSHDQNSIPSTPIDSSASILLLAGDIDVVGIDEAQFLDNGLVDVCNTLANRGDRDSRLRSPEPWKQCLPSAKARQGHQKALRRAPHRRSTAVKHA